MFSNRIFMTRAIVVITLVLLTGCSENAPYKDITPTEADAMVRNGSAVILDVRTPQEWKAVGHPGPDRSGRGQYLEGRVLNIPYEIFYQGTMGKNVMAVNPRFVAEVEQVLDKDDGIVIICRSGNRSVYAAMALHEAGFRRLYNVTTGFEGERDAAGRRTVNGWKVDGLPYNDSPAGAYGN